LSSQWCTRAQLLDQIPEFRSDNQAGILDNDTLDRNIEQATILVKAKVAGRFDLAVIEAALTADTLKSIQYTTANQAAAQIVIRYNLGTQADGRLSNLKKELKSAYHMIAAGTLFYDDNTAVATRNAPSSFEPGIPDSLGILFDDGDRYAQPT
jgi:hypothetical protein